MKQHDTPRFLCLIVLWLLFFPSKNNYAQTLNFDQTRNNGLDYEDKNLLDSALIEYGNALQIAQKEANQFQIATIYTDLAIVSRKRADYIECQRYHEAALVTARKSNDAEMIGDNLHGLGSLYELIGDYERAVTYYLNALELSQQKGDKEGVIVTLQNISKTYMQLNYRDLAVNNIENALKLSASIGNDSTKANIMHDFGEILVHFGDNLMALEKLKSTLTIYEKLGHGRLIGSTLVYIGGVYTRLEQPELALEYFNRAFKYEKEMDAYVLADLFHKTGNVHLLNNNAPLAKTYFEKCLKLTTTYEYKFLQQKSAQKLYELAATAGKESTALQMLQLSTSLKDSIYNLEKSKRVAEMQLKYDNEKQQKELKNLELKQNRMILFGSATLFALVIGFMAYSTHTSNRNRKILEQKQIEIQHQNVQLLESNEVLRQFAYVAAHDLKEPLRTICSFIDLLEIKFGQKIKDPQAVEFMHFISDAAKRMNILLTDLLEYSSIFHQKPGSDNVAPAKVLDEVTTNLKTLIDSKNGQVEYGRDFPIISITRIHLVQIFQNLVGNAVKFTPADRDSNVKVSWSYEGKEIVFAVKDNGVGIRDRHREKIFNLFFRAHDAKTYEGTGIGLSICKSLTEKYSGRIWFQSVENQGTTFFFSLPKDLVLMENVILEKKMTA